MDKFLRILIFFAILFIVPFRTYAATLLDAAKKDDSQLAEELLKAGADPNQDFGAGVTALHICADYNALKTAVILVLHGAKVNVKTQKGEYPINLAARSGSVEVGKLLIENGADLQHHDGYSSFHALALILDRFTFGDDYAVKKFTYFVKLFLANGISIDDRTDQGDTLLHLSSIGVRATHFPAVKLLISLGANVNVQNKSNTTPLHYASVGNPEVVELLYSHGAFIDAQDKDGNTPLIISLLRGNSNNVSNLLVKLGANLNLRSKTTTALYEALRFREFELAKTMVDAGADVNAIVERGRRPLHLALDMEWLSLGITEFIVSHGADVNAADEKGLTVLHNIMALFLKNELSLIRLFLEKGANVDARDIDGNTPLLFAVKSHFLQNWQNRFDLLFSAKANVNATNLLGEFPLEIVSMYSDEFGYEMASYFVDKGADVKLIKNIRAVVWHAFENSYLKMFKLFAKYDSNLDEKDPSGRTMLCLAARSGSLEKASILLDSGANVNARCGEETPLKIANSHEMRKFLILRGGVE